MKTQKEAVGWARRNKPFAPRAQLKDKKLSDHLRAA
jgi:hypothetical protein